MDIVFDHQGQTMQRAQDPAVLAHLIEFLGAQERSFRINSDKGIEARCFTFAPQ